MFFFYVFPPFLGFIVDTKVDGSRTIQAGAGSRIAARSVTTQAEPPRTLLRGILSQQPTNGSSSGSGSSVGGGASSGSVGLVNLHSILQPGHPALRPGGGEPYPLHHPSLAHHPHVKPGMSGV